ncbi:MAG: M23 family metallopeptidase, partial [Lewinella sp.]|nr:M23 family metallopeptidase [Lewinella sp.]
RRQVAIDAVGEMAAARSNSPMAGSTDIPLEQLFFVAPVRGEISAGFKPDEGHLGVDILGPKGTAIKACLDGYVILSDYTYETGHTIGIQHANNVISFYKHNSELLKEVGDFVQAGEAVAIIGNTGTLSSGPHLHFELWHKGMAVDPTEYVKF